MKKHSSDEAQSYAVVLNEHFIHLCPTFMSFIFLVKKMLWKEFRYKQKIRILVDLKPNISALHFYVHTVFVYVCPNIYPVSS